MHTPDTLMNSGWLIPLFLATLYNATPLVLAALGGVLSERAGVVNIALEGLMLTGAFVGIWAGQSNALVGLFAALCAGALLGLLHAFLTQKTRMNHVVSGLGITLLAAGGTRFLFQRVFPSSGIQIEGINLEMPGVKFRLLGVHFVFHGARVDVLRLVFLTLAIILPFVVAFLVSRTRFGLRLRAVGENPESARMAGIKAVPVRFAAVTLSGVLGALGGAYLSMGNAHRFSPDMSAGKGYIALAAVIFGKWNPLGAALGALFFGFFDALQSQMQISGVHLTWLGVEWTSPFLLQSLPYLMTVAALVTVVGRATPPAALGQETG